MGNVSIDASVTNQTGVPMVFALPFASFPVAGVPFRIGFRTDAPYGIYMDNGSSFILIAEISGGGVLSLAAIGSAANANGGTITGTVLNLQPADASFGGVVTTGVQSFAGAKTFTGIVSAPTASPGTNTTQLATTAFVTAADAALGALYLLLTGGTLTGGLTGTTANFTGILTLGSTINKGAFVFTLPGSSGTLALTSALAAYLPLAGGTLTGALAGTSYNFTSTGVVQAGLSVGASAYQNYAAIFVGGTTTVSTSQYAILTDAAMNGTANSAFWANCKIRAAATATNGYGLYVQNPEMGAAATLTNDYGIYIENQTRGGTLNYSIYSAGGLNYFAGATTLGAALSGTSSTFSSFNTLGNIRLSSNPTGIEFYNTSGLVRNWQISAQNINDQSLDFTPSTANGGTTYSTPTLSLKGSTGAATFSGSVTVQSLGVLVTIDDAGKSGYTITNSAAVRTYKMIAGIDGTSNTGFSIRNVTAGRNELLFTDGGAATFSSSITTAAPSGGTAKPFKVGAVSATGPAIVNKVMVEIDSVVYYIPLSAAVV